MENCEVLVVGGGPSGSSCAGRLRQAGIDVLLLDSHTFPRQKPCAGWITPAVFKVLALEPGEYRPGRVLQDINSFRTGLIDGATIVTSYETTVSYGILRDEFDHFLLQRSCVRQSQGEPVTSLERRHDCWIVNRRIRARILVGAGGHFCPVARQLGAKVGREEIVAARVAEFPMSQEDERRCSTPAETPALFFCRDMRGYGWLFRKGNYLNIGLGRMDMHHLAQHSRKFCEFLVRHGYLASDITDRMQGHAYRVFQRHGGRRCVGDGVLLVGDAAGVARSFSGEGILPSIESGLAAAETILAAKGDYRCSNLEAYAAKMALQHSAVHVPTLLSGVVRTLAARLLSSTSFTRNIVLDRWFLNSEQGRLYST